MIESFLSFGNPFNLKGHVSIRSTKTINSLVNAIFSLATFNRFVFVLFTSRCLKCLFFLLPDRLRCSFEYLIYWLLKDVVQLNISWHIVWVERICWKLATQPSLLVYILCVQCISAVVLSSAKISNFWLCSFDVINLHYIPWLFLITFCSWCPFNIFTAHMISYKLGLISFWTKEQKRATISVSLKPSLGMTLLNWEFWWFLFKFKECVWFWSDNVFII